MAIIKKLIAHACKHLKILLFFSIIMFLTIFLPHYTPIIMLFLQKHFITWIRPIITAAIGGAIGGFIVYLYVMYIEKRREKRAIQREKNRDDTQKRQVCTQALLGEQASICVQMAEIKSIQESFSKIRSFEVKDQPLTKYLSNITSVSEQARRLCELMKEDKNRLKELLQFVNFIVIQPNYTVNLPYEIFNISSVDLFSANPPVVNLTRHLQNVASCNRKYNDMVSCITRHNIVRDFVVNRAADIGKTSSLSTVTSEELDEYIQIVAATFNLSSELDPMIEKYLALFNETFSEAGKYIEILGITKPIEIKKDKKGNIIYDKQ